MDPDDAVIDARIAYLQFDGKREGARAEHRIFPLSSGRPIVRPAQEYHRMDVIDMRELIPAPTVDGAGFSLVSAPPLPPDPYDDDAIREDYYPAVVEHLVQLLGATDVVVFDHNQRSARRAADGQTGVRTPVEAAHVDYTPESGPRRATEILAAAGRTIEPEQRVALINLWRPLVGPVRDFPLALCDARSTRPADYVPTDIHHFGEDDLEHPRHSGQIYSVCHHPDHAWYYARDMQPDEALMIMNWDSADREHRCYAAHTGFRVETGDDGSPARESIEARTLVIYPA